MHTDELDFKANIAIAMDQKEATQENETHDMSYGKEIESKGGMLTSGASVTTEDNVSQIQHENDLPELSPTSQEVLTCDENEWINHEHTPEKEDSPPVDISCNIPKTMQQGKQGKSKRVGDVHRQRYVYTRHLSCQNCVHAYPHR